jgi:hypothetical protein
VFLFEFPDGAVSTSIQNPAAAPNLQIKFGPPVNFVWQFPSWLYVAQEIDASPLPAITSFELVLKTLGDFDGNAVASNYNSGSNTWVYVKTGVGAAATYTAQVPFNSSALFEALITAAGGSIVDRPANQTARYLLTGLVNGQIVQEVGTMTYWVVIDHTNLANSAGWSSDVTVATSIQLGAELAVFFADGSALKTLPFNITVLASYTEVPGTIVLSTLGGYPAPGTLLVDSMGTIASAGTTAIAASGETALSVTGTTTITAFDNVAAGIKRYLVFAGALTLTYNATSLILPTAANLQTAANDCAIFLSLGSGNWQCLSYVRASGLPLANGQFGLDTAGTIASAGTTNIGAAAVGALSVTGTTAITAFDTIAAGIKRWLNFAGALTLTYNATSLILPTAANITTAANDTALFESLGSGNWQCLVYQRKDGSAFIARGLNPADYVAAAENAPMSKALARQMLINGNWLRWEVAMTGGGSGNGGTSPAKYGSRNVGLLIAATANSYSYLDSGINIIGQATVGAGNADFSRPFWMQWTLCSAGFSGSDTVAYLGFADAFAANGAPDGSTTAGVQIKLTQGASNALNIALLTTIAGTTTTAAALGSMPGLNVPSTLQLYLNGTGNWTLWLNNAQLATGTGAPTSTTSNPSFQAWLSSVIGAADAMVLFDFMLAWE